MWTTIDKFLTALAAAITAAITAGVVPDPAKPYVPIIVAFLGAVGVYLVPNKPSSTP